jgi:hypothetical protein
MPLKSSKGLTAIRFGAAVAAGGMTTIGLLGCSGMAAKQRGNRSLGSDLAYKKYIETLLSPFSSASGISDRGRLIVSSEHSLPADPWIVRSRALSGSQPTPQLLQLFGSRFGRTAKTWSECLSRSIACEISLVSLFRYYARVSWRCTKVRPMD